MSLKIRLVTGKSNETFCVLWLRFSSKIHVPVPLSENENKKNSTFEKANSV